MNTTHYKWAIRLHCLSISGLKDAQTTDLYLGGGMRPKKSKQARVRRALRVLDKLHLNTNI
jgi:hypothetical protein